MSADAPRRASRTELVLLFALGCAAAAAFAGKPVQQDDWAYLRVARGLLEDPAHVLEQTTIYQGQPISAAQGVLHGPVWLWCMAFAQLPLFGAHALLAAHLIGAGFFGLLCASLGALAARLGARPVEAALAAALAPAPWVLSSTLMTDVPMLALFCASLALCARGIAERRWGALALAALAGALAALTRYHGLAIVPMLLLSAFVWAPFAWRNLAPCLGAAALFAGYTLYTRAASGQADVARATDALEALKRIDHEQCLLAAVAALGASALLWLPALLAAAPRALRGLCAARSPALLTVCALGGLGGGLWLALGPAAGQRPQAQGINAALLLACLALGGAAVACALAALLAWPWSALRGAGWLRSLAGTPLGHALWLACWLLGFALAAWWTVPFGSTRYALPALPPIGLALALFAARALPRWALCGALATNACVGALCSMADMRAARVYPAIAELVAERERPGGPWEHGQTWIWGDIGFRWYLEQRTRAQVLSSVSNAPQPGDRILKSAICTSSPDDGRSGPYFLHPELVRRIESREQRRYPDNWPVRVHNAYAAAGFYGAQAGLLPFSFSQADHDELQVWSVVDANPFFAPFEHTQRDEWKARSIKGGNIRVERYLVAEREEQRLAIAITFPGRITWPKFAIPAPGRLGLWIGEHGRLAQFGEPGPGSIARVRVDGAIAAERSLDTRRNAADRGWQRWNVDLSAWAGREVALSFEAEAQPAPAGCPSEFEKYIQLGFAEPSFAPAR